IYHIKARGLLNEMTCQSPIQTSKQIDKLEKLANKKLQKQISHSIKQAQKKQSDVYGFGERYRNNHPKDWKKIRKNWPIYFGNADIRVHVDISIQRTLLRTSPIHKIYTNGDEKNEK